MGWWKPVIKQIFYLSIWLTLLPLKLKFIKVTFWQWALVSIFHFKWYVHKHTTSHYINCDGPLPKKPQYKFRCDTITDTISIYYNQVTVEIHHYTPRRWQYETTKIGIAPEKRRLWVRVLSWHQFSISCPTLKTPSTT